MYDELMRVWKTEKLNTFLQPLDARFYSDLEEYLAKLRNDRDDPSLKPLNLKLIDREIQNVVKLANAIVDARIQKLTRSLGRGMQLTAGQNVDSESNAIEDLRGLLNLRLRLKGVPHTASVIAIEKERTLVRILQPIQKIVCVDTKSYGPFEAEDIANLPKENASLLVERGIASRVEASA